jgi:hypothetical protein
MKTAAIAIIIATSLLIPKAHAVLGVGDIVYDPTVHATDTAKWSWEQVQWAEKLATLHDTLTTVRENLQTLILVKTAIGDPAAIPAILDELMLDGALSESGIFQIVNEIGGIVREGGLIALQLQYLAEPVDLDGMKAAARGGNFWAYRNPADPLMRYRATQMAFERYNARLQGSAYRARYMRSQLSTLNSRLGSSSTDAETQKLQSSLIIADSALQNIEIQIQHDAEQVELAHTMAESRAGEEQEAQRAAMDEAQHEVEANLELPVAEISEVVPQF